MKKGSKINTNEKSKLRRVCYTLNNYTDDEVKAIKGMPHVRAQIFGRETTKEGTPHLQGAILFDRSILFKTIRKMLGGRAHVERMAANDATKAFDYCRKEDPNPFEFGEVPKPGKRNDLIDFVQQVREGRTMEELALEDRSATILIKYARGVQYWNNLVNKSTLLNKKTVVWLYGPSGIGKTRTAVEFAMENNLSYWISNQDLKWCDGYTTQDVIVVDDFRWKHCTFSFILRLFDRYELNVPIKGGFVRWNPKVIFITTPLTIQETFSTDWRKAEDLKQIHRRVDHEWNMADGKPVEILKELAERFPKEKEEDEVDLILNHTAVRMQALSISDASDEEEYEGLSPYDLFQASLSPNDVVMSGEACIGCGFEICVCSESESDIFVTEGVTSDEFDNKFKFF